MMKKMHFMTKILIFGGVVLYTGLALWLIAKPIATAFGRIGIIAAL